jgi:hypothetical protein
MTEERLDRIEQTLNTLVGGQVRIEGRLARVEGSQEELKDAAKQIAEGHTMLQASMDRGFADMKAHIDNRIAPIAGAVQRHSAILGNSA